MFNFKSSAEFLTKCQVLDNSEISGTVCPWVLNEGKPPREDFHDTLEAVYIWSRPENSELYSYNILKAMEYIERKYGWFMSEAEPLKSYDATYLLLALHRNPILKEYKQFQVILDYAKQYMTEFFTRGPEHNQREYSNPYWKAFILDMVLKDDNQPTGFLRGWLTGDLSLESPHLEGLHKGKGFEFNHDFFSTFGTKLLAINEIDPSLSYSALRNIDVKGYVKRELDETSFNASVLFGISSCPFDCFGKLELDSVIFDIKEKLESKFESGGIKRGSYFPLRESWPTFFVYFAELIIERKKITLG